MRGPFETRRLAALSLCAGLVAAFWLVAGPRQLGGPVSYALVSGSSMEPRLHRGDLVLLRQGGAPRVGDVVGYRDPEIGRVVLHRVIRRNGDRYVMKGDNNSFVDPTQPARADLVGRLWVRLPAAGSAIAWLREPLHAAVLGALAVLAAGLSTRGGPWRRRRAASRPVTRLPLGPSSPYSDPAAGPLLDRRAAAPSVRVAAPSDAAARALLAVFGVAALAGLAVTSWAGAQTSMQRAAVAGGYTQSGSISYAGRASPSAVYPGGAVRTGQPVFDRIARRVRVRFDYRLAGRGVRDVSGTVRLVGHLRNGKDWRQPVDLGGPIAFRGDRATATAVLDVAALRALGDGTNALIGSSVGTYRLTVEPRVHVRGTVGGRPIDARLGQIAAFELDRLSLRPVDGARFARTKSETWRIPQARHVTVLGARLPAGRFRAISIAFSLVALAGAAAAAAWSLAVRRRAGAPRTLEWRLRDREVVDVEEGQPLAARVVDVASIGDLLRLADLYERALVRQREGDAWHYLVVEDGVGYRYTSVLADEPALLLSPRVQTLLRPVGAREGGGEA